MDFDVGELNNVHAIYTDIDSNTINIYIYSWCEHYQSLLAKNYDFQRPMTKIYPAEISLNAMMFFLATLQTAPLACATSRKAFLWRLTWDLELINIFFGVCIYIYFSGATSVF